MSESIRNALERSLVPTKNPKDDSFVPTSSPTNNVPTNITSTNFVPTLSEEGTSMYRDIESMVKCSGGTMDDFLADLDIKLTIETLPLKNGVIDIKRFEVDDELDKELNDLRNACEEKGVSVVEAIKKAKQGIWGVRQ